jgi:integrase
MGRRSETGGVKPQGDRIAIRLTYQGSDIQPTLALKPTAANLKHARRLRESILEEMKVGTFRIADHFPEYRFAERYIAADDPGGRTLKEWADVWHKLAARDLEHSTLKIYKRHLDAYWLSAFGDMMPRAVTYERVLTHLASLTVLRIDTTTGKVSKALSRKTQNNILIPLRAVFELICRAPGAPPNPTEGIDNLKVQTGDPDPFTLEEVELALDYVRSKSRGSAAMADYFEFAAFAGPASERADLAALG